MKNMAEQNVCSKSHQDISHVQQPIVLMEHIND